MVLLLPKRTHSSKRAYTHTHTHEQAGAHTHSNTQKRMLPCGAEGLELDGAALAKAHPQPALRLGVVHSFQAHFKEEEKARKMRTGSEEIFYMCY